MALNINRARRAARTVRGFTFTRSSRGSGDQAGGLSASWRSPPRTSTVATGPWHPQVGGATRHQTGSGSLVSMPA